MKIALEQLTEEIDQALQAKLIYNVDFESLKYHFGKLFDVSRDAAQSIYLSNKPVDPRGGQRFTKKQIEALYWIHPQLNTFAKFGRDIKVASEVATEKTELEVVAAYQILYDTFAPVAAKLNALKAFIKKGRKPSDRPRLTDPRTLDHTGTCPVCGRNIKLEDGVMVMHGYDIQHGFQNGKCFGVGYPPIEVSDSGVRAFRNAIRAQRDNLQKALVGIPALDSFTIIQKYGEVGTKTIKRGEAGFERQVGIETDRLKSEINWLNSEIKNCEAVISNWKPCALPDGNGDHLK